MSGNICLGLSCAVVLACGGGLPVAAQEHPFLAHYDLTELPGAIRIDWTIQGGSTCYGQEVERSTNGIDFAQVHHIEGLCGDPAIAVAYDWTDAAPPELSTVHYRIKLGLDGYSSVKTVQYEQLTSTTHVLFPNPAGDEATLVLNTSFSGRMDVFLFDGAGRQVLASTGGSGRSVALDLRSLAVGSYSYLVLVGDSRFRGVFIKA